MSAPFSTLYLDVAAWDLVADASGNIAMAAPPYAIVQDVASACRTFYDEVYYDDTLGVQYLGANPPTNEAGAIAAAALTVPTVATAVCVVSSFINRIASGQVQFETDDGTTLEVAI